MAWIIESTVDKDEDGLPLTWSNDQGWGSGYGNYDTFTDEEVQIYDLPVNGIWVWVEWRAS
jgi:hypothetical protein